MEYLYFLAKLFFSALITIPLACVMVALWAGRIPEQTERDEFTARIRWPDEPE